MMMVHKKGVHKNVGFLKVINKNELLIETYFV